MAKTGGFMMRCLIPVDQEKFPSNALKRAEKICDEIIILYIVNKDTLNRIQQDSSYILPSYALESLKESIINVQKKEAENIKKNIKSIPVELRFVIGGYYEMIEKENLRCSPNMIMVDEFSRRLLKLEVPLWIDKGIEIKKGTFVISSLKKVKLIKSNLDMIENLSKRLNIQVYLYPKGINPELLKNMGKITEKIKGSLLIIQKGSVEKFKNWKYNMLIL